MLFLFNPRKGQNLGWGGAGGGWGSVRPPRRGCWRGAGGRRRKDGAARAAPRAPLDAAGLPPPSRCSPAAPRHGGEQPGRRPAATPAQRGTPGERERGAPPGAVLHLGPAAARPLGAARRPRIPPPARRRVPGRRQGERHQLLRVKCKRIWCKSVWWIVM